MQTSNLANPLKRIFSGKTPDRMLVYAGNKARDAQLWAEATGHYAGFLKLNPDDFGIWVQLGNCAKEAKQFDKALEAYDSAIQINDKNADVFLQKGHLLKLMGRISDAIACYQQSFALERHDNPAFLELVAMNGLNVGAPFRVTPMEGRAGLGISNIYLDVTDLIDYLKVNVSLSGIQRVVSNLIVHADAYTNTVSGVCVQVVLPDYNGSRVYALDQHHIEALIRMVVLAQTDRDHLDTVLQQVVSAKSEVVLTSGDTLVIAGAFWIYQRYDLLNALRQAGVRVTVFIHDLIQVTNPEFVEMAATTVFRRSLVDVLNVSSYVMTNSKFVEQDVRTYLKTRMNFNLAVTAVPLATELGKTSFDRNKVQRDYFELVTEEYVLCVGTIEIRKNHIYLIKLWERLISEFPGNIPNLVFVGKWGWQVDELRTHLAGSDHLGGRLYIYNGISDIDLRFLYENCLFTIYPSFAEGWGLPVGESLGYGKPCVASNVTSIPEVGGAFCRYIDPFDLDDGYRVVSAILADRPGLVEWTSDIQRNFVPKTWKDFSIEFFGLVSRYQRDSTFDRSGNNCIIEIGEIASFGNDALVQLDIQNRRFVSARMTRMSGWHGLEGWGCWASRRRASLRLTTRLEQGTEVLVYLRLQTPDGDSSADCTIKIGAQTKICTGLGPASQWVTASGIVDTGGVVDITLISGKGYHLRTERELYIGISALAIAPSADLEMRLKTLEQIVPGGILDERDLVASLRELRDAKASSERHTATTAVVDAPGSPFWHYNSSFDAQAVIRHHAVAGLTPRAGYVTNFLGVAIDPKFFPEHLSGREGQIEPIPIPTNWHADIAEWASILRAVDLARERFTVIELGCGWACWMNNAGVAAKRRGLDVHVIGVEGDAAHISFARESLATNGFTPDQITLRHGIAASHKGTALFPQGNRDGLQWGNQPRFGVSDAERDEAVASGQYEALEMFTVAELAAPYSRIDLLHIDIQGGEADLVAGSLATLNEKVAYMFIGSHSREIEGRLFQTLLSAGWVLETERPGFLSLNEHGTYMHCDGAQGWRNKALLPTP